MVENNKNMYKFLFNKIKEIHWHFFILYHIYCHALQHPPAPKAHSEPGKTLCSCPVVFSNSCQPRYTLSNTRTHSICQHVGKLPVDMLNVFFERRRGFSCLWLFKKTLSRTNYKETSPPMIHAFVLNCCVKHFEELEPLGLTKHLWTEQNKTTAGFSTAWIT